MTFISYTYQDQGNNLLNTVSHIKLKGKLSFSTICIVNLCSNTLKNLNAQRKASLVAEGQNSK